jgi:hypothetical protein
MRAITDEGYELWRAAPADGREVLFPPDLVPLLRSWLPGHPALRGVPDAALSRLLTLVFFTSLQTEELERLPLRLAFVGADPGEAIPATQGAAETASYQWRALRFGRPAPCDARTLLKLSRAAFSGRLFAMVSLSGGALEIVGLAREGFRLDADRVLKLIAPTPGCIEVWSGSRRALEYVRGRIQTPPESVLLAAGPIRRALTAFAATAGAPAGYIESVAGLVREMSAHSYGGILVLGGEAAPDLSPGGFSIDLDVPLGALLRELSRYEGSAGRDSPRPRRRGAASLRIVRDALRAEIDRVIVEIGRMTALDGATLLDRELGLRGFGVVLSILPEVRVSEACDAEASREAPFAFSQHGARHRAAASYAFANPGSVVFVASADGGLGCLLREPGAPRALLWRFRPSDLPPG